MFSKPFDAVVLRYLGVTICAASVFFIGFVDVISDYRIDYSIFYFIPISVASIFLRRFIGTIMALTATAVYGFANNAAYTTPFYLYLNVFLHAVSFLIIGIAFARLKEDYDRIQTLKHKLFRAHHRL